MKLLDAARGPSGPPRTGCRSATPSRSRSSTAEGPTRVTPSRLLTLLAALVLAGTGVAAPPAGADRPDDTDASTRPATLQLLVNGYGHGHGLSQWGAQGQALAGRSHRQILGFYYPGLRRGASAGNIRVLVTADTSDDLVVLDRPRLQVRSYGNGRTYALDEPAAARRWRLLPVDGGTRTAVAWADGRGGWRTLRTVPGQAEITAGGPPLRLILPGGSRRYRGSLRSVMPSRSSAGRDTVNVLPLESYLRGVLPREVYTSWHADALRAQAVAARTYAAHERAAHGRRYFHVYDTTASQAYGGADDEVASTDAAIRVTAGEVLTSGGRPAYTQFSASNGGWTAAGSQPYLPAKQDPYDDRYRGVADNVSAGELERAFSSIGSFRRIRVLDRDGNGQWGGRVTSVRVVGSAGSTTVSGETFRFAVGLRSTWFTQR